MRMWVRGWGSEGNGGGAWETYTYRAQKVELCLVRISGGKGQ